MVRVVRDGGGGQHQRQGVNVPPAADRSRSQKNSRAERGSDFDDSPITKPYNRADSRTLSNKKPGLNQREIAENTGPGAADLDIDSGVNIKPAIEKIELFLITPGELIYSLPQSKNESSPKFLQQKLTNEGLRPPPPETGFGRAVMIVINNAAPMDRVTELLRSLNKPDNPWSNIPVILEGAEDDLAGELKKWLTVAPNLNLKGIAVHNTLPLTQVCSNIANGVDEPITSALIKQTKALVDLEAKILRAKGGNVNLGILSSCEKPVAELMANRLSNKEIAGELHLSIHTIKNHVHNILRKLGVSSRAEVADWYHANSFE